MSTHFAFGGQAGQRVDEPDHDLNCTISRTVGTRCFYCQEKGSCLLIKYTDVEDNKMQRLICKNCIDELFDEEKNTEEPDDVLEDDPVPDSPA